MIDIINLPYPMFITSPKEKELLRKVELAVTNKPLDSWFGLCAELNELFDGSNNNSIFVLKSKISGNIAPACYFHNYLLLKSCALNTHYYSLNHVDQVILERYLRLVWINKLLNYTGE